MTTMDSEQSYARGGEGYAARTKARDVLPPVGRPLPAPSTHWFVRLLRAAWRWL